MRRLVATAFVVTAILVQVTILNRIPLPDGRPDLLVIVVVALAIVRGPEYGAVAGFACGLATVLVVAAGSAAVVIGYAGVGALLGDERITVAAVRSSLLATVLYDVVLAPFVVPVVSGAARRAEPAGHGVRA